MAQACPGCGKGSHANLTGTSYGGHIAHCSSVLFDVDRDNTLPNKEPNNNSINSNNNNDNGYTNPPIFRVAVEAAGNPVCD